MDKFKMWALGAAASALLASGGWAWSYILSNESRVSKLEVHTENLKEGQEEIKEIVIRIEDKIERLAK